MIQVGFFRVADSVHSILTAGFPCGPCTSEVWTLDLPLPGPAEGTPQCFGMPFSSVSVKSPFLNRFGPAATRPAVPITATANTAKVPQPTNR